MADRPIPRARYLLPSRIVEQGALGLGTLLLARRLGLDGFAAISVLVVINSMAVTASDFGLGLALLRHPADRSLSTRSLTRLRLLNSAVAAIAVLIGLMVQGTTGQIVAAGGLMWVTSGEAFVRKSAALRLRHDKQVATAEVIGAAVFLGAVLVAYVYPERAVVLTTAAFVGKHVVECLIARSWPAAFRPKGDEPDLGPLLAIQLLEFMIANVDFVIVGLVFSPATLSVYVLAFRISSVAPAQVARVATRISMVGFAASESGRQSSYDRYVRNLFAVGVFGGIATAAGGWVLPVILGDQWGATTWVIVVLAVAVPLRLVLAIAGSLALAGGPRVTRRLLRWELVRVGVYALAFAVAARIGFGAFVAAASLCQIGATYFYNRLAAGATEVRSAWFVAPACVVAAVLALLASTFVTTPS